jgi:CheY-specific phosphatase CheX
MCIAVGALVLASATPRSASAQQSGFAGVAGSVVDSIHGGVPLPGAVIRVNGVNREAKTDANGQFKIDSVPAGNHSLSLMHPLLDTLGIGITTREIPFTAGNTLAVEMAIPSAQTVLERSCAAAWRARGPSALVGKVLDADTDTPLVGAKVSLVWYQLSLTTLKKEPVFRSQTAGPDGTYRICGLPGDVDGTVQAEFNGRKTAEVRVTMDETNPLAFQSLRIGTAVVAEVAPDTAARPTSGTQLARDTTPVRLRGPARLTGRVVNAAGAPVANARVDVQGTGAATLSRQDGTFGFTDLPSGTQSLVVRQLGFEPVETAVELSAREPKQVTVRMTKAAQVIAEVKITERAKEGLDQVGFNQRRKTGFGYYMGLDEINNRQATRMTDLFRSIPSLRVVPSGMDYVVQSARDATGGCVRYVVDGAPYQSLFAGDIDRLMPPNDVAAIEVYSGTNTPAEFQAPGNSSCTVIVMWSKFKVKKDR